MPRLPHARRHFDPHGRFVGYTRVVGQLDEPAEVDVRAVGKAAIFDEAGRQGRISDVIFELDTGEILAYEFVDDGGAAYYLPATALHHETASELHFPASPAELASPDLGALGDRLAAGPPPEDPDEFTIVERFPGPDETP